MLDFLKNTPIMNLLKVDAINPHIPKRITQKVCRYKPISITVFIKNDIVFVVNPMFFGFYSIYNILRCLLMYIVIWRPALGQPILCGMELPADLLSFGLITLSNIVPS